MVQAVAADQTESMKTAMDELQKEVMAMGQAVYSQPGAEGGAPPPPGGDAGGAPPPPGGKPDDVIDADFTDSKDTKDTK